MSIHVLRNRLQNQDQHTIQVKNIHNQNKTLKKTYIETTDHKTANFGNALG